MIVDDHLQELIEKGQRQGYKLSNNDIIEFSSNEQDFSPEDFLELKSALLLEDIEIVENLTDHDLDSHSETKLEPYNITDNTQNGLQVYPDQANANIEYDRNKSIESNMPLVIKIASNYKEYAELDDLIQEGTLGLLEATEKFDANKKCKFSTYATYYIRYTIFKFLKTNGQTIKLPDHINRAITKFNKTKTALEKSKGEEPTIDEIAEAMGIAVTKAEELLLYAQSTISLDKNINDEYSTALSDIIEDKIIDSPENVVVQGSIRKQFEDAIKTFKPREQEIIRFRYNFDTGEILLTNKEISEKYDISPQRVSQVISKLNKKFQKTIDLRN